VPIVGDQALLLNLVFQVFVMFLACFVGVFVPAAMTGLGVADLGIEATAGWVLVWQVIGSVLGCGEFGILCYKSIVYHPWYEILVYNLP
jgi:hypothetical protein